MSSKLQNIYTYLVGNRKHESVGWHSEYKEFSKDVKNIKTSLSGGKTLFDKDVYTNTTFKDDDNPKWEFLKKLFDNKSNGISTNGQSIVSNVNFEKIESDAEFIEIVNHLIQNPTYENHNKLRDKWYDILNQNNPVLTNRATAACTIKVSSTVDEGKFNQIFEWFQKKRLIDQYDGEKDWYHKNIFLFNQSSKLLDEDDPYWISIFIWIAYENITNPFALKKQVVKYGAPGTGKTYEAKKIARLQFDIWKSMFAEEQELSFEDVKELVQFHPSYSYEDFMEGLRPNIKNGQTQLKLQNGVFKSFCIEAGRWEVDIASFPLSKKFSELTIADIKPYKEKLVGDYWNYIFNQTEINKKIVDILPPYFIIIDEINRAELSRVFGELMYCLEYRGVGGAIKTQYAQLNDDGTGMIKLGNSFQFFVPHNLYILATMNTIDRSVESFDFALRRRFKWEEVLPDTQLLHYHLQEFNPRWIKLSENLEALNTSIKDEALLGKDYCIGHAYLWELPYPKELSVTEVKRNIWNDSISPLIEEYLRGTGRDDLLKKFANKFGIR